MEISDVIPITYTDWRKIWRRITILIGGKLGGVSKFPM